MNILPKKITVIAPHPDDEILGAGGTIARFLNMGAEVSILFVSGHLPPVYHQNSFDVTQAEAKKAMEVLGVSDFEFLKIPATMIHEIPIADLNNKINDFLKSRNPDFVLIPFPDRHIDHRVIFDSALVACRPVRTNFPRIVLAYETLSETHWNAPGIEPSFTPEFYVDISSYIENKKLALNQYTSQLEESPSRSIEACVALAKFRGSQNGCSYAEAFKVIRIVV